MKDIDETMLGLLNYTTTWKASEAPVQIQYSSIIQRKWNNEEPDKATHPNPTPFLQLY